MDEEPGSKSKTESTGAPGGRTRATARRAEPRISPAAVKPTRKAAPKQPEKALAAPPAPIADAGKPVRLIEATTVNINQGGAGEVEAESIGIHQGGIGAASAEDITVSVGGIGMAQADDIAVRMGVIGVARGERVSAEMGSIGIAIGRDVSVRQGFARAVLAGNVRIGQGGAGSVVAANATFEKGSGTVVLLARRVEGDVRTVLDWRGALVAGAALGIAIALFSRRKPS